MNLGKIIENTIGLYRKYVSLIRFGIVGVINTGVDFGVFTLYSEALGGAPMMGQVLGYCAGFANSFVMNKLWTFENRKSKIGTHIELIKFAAVNLVSIGLSLAGIYILNTRMGINKYYAKAAVTVLTQIVNYFGYKLWVFKAVN